MYTCLVMNSTFLSCFIYLLLCFSLCSCVFVLWTCFPVCHCVLWFVVVFSSSDCYWHFRAAIVRTLFKSSKCVYLRRSVFHDSYLQQPQRFDSADFSTCNYFLFACWQWSGKGNCTLYFIFSIISDSQRLTWVLLPHTAHARCAASWVWSVLDNHTEGSRAFCATGIHRNNIIIKVRMIPETHG